MYGNILIPVELDYEEGLQKSLKAAHLLANDDAKITLMYVMEDVPGYVRGQIPEDTLKKRRSEVESALKNIASKVKGARIELESGHAGNNIVNFANESDVDCIIISSHTPKLQKFFLGSTADRVVTHADCTVVVIR